MATQEIMIFYSLRRNSRFALARRYKLNLSKILEESLITELKTRWQNDWLNENKAAISAYNERIAQHGVFSDGIRRF